MLGRRGKGTGAVTGVPLNPNLQKTIAADAGADIAQEVAAPVTKSRFQTRFTKDGRGPNEIRLARQATPGYGVTAPPSILNPYDPQRQGTGPRRFKGGGIAKRGTGVALKHGGRVKSMGIAKRGGGVAKR